MKTPERVTASPTVTVAALREQYSCGPVRFSGRDDALYDRHLVFDRVVTREKASSRDKFEAAARAVRDVF